MGSSLGSEINPYISLLFLNLNETFWKYLKIIEIFEICVFWKKSSSHILGLVFCFSNDQNRFLHFIGCYLVVSRRIFAIGDLNLEKNHFMQPWFSHFPFSFCEKRPFFLTSTLSPSKMVPLVVLKPSYSKTTFNFWSSGI